MSLLTVGTMAYDALETPFGKTDRILGGAATYIALSASYHVEKSNIVSVVGADFEQQHLDLLSGKGVDLEGVQIIPDGKTFFWKGKYHTDMNTRDTLDTQLNVLETFNPIVPEDFKDCKYLMLGNLIAVCTAEGSGPTAYASEIGGFRYHELLDGPFLGRSNDRA